MPGLTAASGMMAGGGPDGTMARNRTPPAAPWEVADTGVGAAWAGAARSVGISARRTGIRTGKTARRTKP